MAAGLVLDGQPYYVICIALTTLWMLLLTEHLDQRTLPSGERNASLFHTAPALRNNHGLGQMDTGKGLSSVSPPSFRLGSEASDDPESVLVYCRLLHALAMYEHGSVLAPFRLLPLPELHRPGPAILSLRNCSFRSSTLCCTSNIS